MKSLNVRGKAETINNSMVKKIWIINENKKIDRKKETDPQRRLEN